MMMMSSEEETDCVVMQERLLKKSKRTRQRVDAGEPRNSYASIPNFSSRPSNQSISSSSTGLILPPPSLLQLAATIPSGTASTVSMLHHSHLLQQQQQQQQQQHSLTNNNNNGYNFLGSPVHGVSGGVCSSSSPPFVSCPPPGNTLVSGVGNVVVPSVDLKGGILVVQTNEHSSSSGQRYHHQHHHNRHHHNRQQQQHHHHHRSVSFDMGSDGEGKPSRDAGELRLNGGTTSSSLKESEVTPHQHHHHHHHSLHSAAAATATSSSSSSSDENSLLLREILQGGVGVGGKGMIGGGENSSSSPTTTTTTTTSPVYNLLPNGKGAGGGSCNNNNNSDSIICHLLKNASSSASSSGHRNNNNNSNNKKDANNVGVGLTTKDEDDGENEIEDEDEDSNNDDDDDEVELVQKVVDQEEGEEVGVVEGENYRKQQQQEAGSLLRGSSNSQESAASTIIITEEVGDCGRNSDIISKEQKHLLQQQQQRQQKKRRVRDDEDNDDDDDDVEEEELNDDDEEDGQERKALSKSLNLCNRRSSSTMNQVVDETFIESATVACKIEEIDDEEAAGEKERGGIAAAAAASKATSAASVEGGGVEEEEEEEEVEEEDEEVDDEDDEDIDEDRRRSRRRLRPLSPDSPGSTALLRYNKLKANNKSNVTSTLSFGTSSSSSAELKRARVENIISSMRSSPSRPSTIEVPQVNGCKKRKLYMPQQHEAIRMANALAAAAALSPPPRDLLLCMDDELLGPVPCKQRRAEQDLLRQQLTQMQSQIAAIQHKLDLYEGPSSDSDVVGSSQSDDGQPDVIPVQNEARNGSPRGGVNRVGNTPPPLLFHLGFGAGRDERTGPGRGGGPGGSTSICKRSTPDLEPAHFIDEARRLVSEQERLTKEVDTCKMMMTASSAVAVTTSASPAEPRVAATAAAAAAAVAAASGPVPRPPSAVIPPDWESLADILKLGMSSLIDDWVRRCASKPTSCLPSVAELGSSSSSHSHSNSKEHTQQQSAHQQLPPPPHTATTSSSSTPSLSSSSSSLSSMMAASSVAVTSVVNSLHLPSDRRSPRTKVIDRGRMGSMGGGGGGGAGVNSIASSLAHLPPPSSAPNMAALFGSSTNFGDLHLKPPHVTAAMFPPPKPPMPIYVSHPSPHHSLSFYGQTTTNGGGGGGGDSPEQSEALPLVVTPKKKRHKVTDTRITPRTVSRLLGHQDHLSSGGGGGIGVGDGPKYSLMGGGGSPVEGVGYHHHHPPPIVPVSLPTSVAIPNPSLHQSDVFSPYPYYHHGPHHGPRGSPHSDGPMMDEAALLHPSHPAAQHHHHHHHAAAVALHSSLFMGAAGHAPSPDTLQQLTNQLKTENGGDSSDCNSGTDLLYDPNLPTSSTLTPMHLRKAKLMFFYVRYPSSAILKTFFPDIKFNKNNTAQLVKWFSNFREFFYIQMEKYARQALSEGCKGAEELTVTVDSELYRVLNLHYNRNNHIEVPTNFRYVVEQTLREFFKSILAGKDQEQSWKKSIYKVIARMDDNVPDYFKSPNFLEQLE